MKIEITTSKSFETGIYNYLEKISKDELISDLRISASGEAVLCNPLLTWVEASKVNKNLRVLSCSGISFKTCEWFDKFVMTINEHGITRLLLTKCLIDDAQCMLILDNLPELMDLSLDNNDITSNGLVNIHLMKNLRRANFANNPGIGDVGASLIFKHLAPRLYSLSLRKTGITRASCESIKKLLRTHCYTETPDSACSIDLSRNNIGDEGVLEIFSNIHVDTDKRVLSLADNNLTDLSIFAISRHGQKYAQLLLDHNIGITDASVAWLYMRGIEARINSTSISPTMAGIYQRFLTDGNRHAGDEAFIRNQILAAQLVILMSAREFKLRGSAARKLPPELLQVICAFLKQSKQSVMSSRNAAVVQNIHENEENAELDETDEEDD